MQHLHSFALLPFVGLLLSLFLRGRRLGVGVLALVLCGHSHLELPTSQGWQAPPCCVLAQAISAEAPTFSLPRRKLVALVQRKVRQIHVPNPPLPWRVRAPPQTVAPRPLCA